MTEPEEFGIENYEWRDGKLDVFEDVAFEDRRLTELPFQFGNVYGFFASKTPNLMTLKGAPESVHGTFACSQNKILDLTGAPRFVSGDFHVTSNYLQSFKGSPILIGGDFHVAGHGELIRSFIDLPIILGQWYIDEPFFTEEINFYFYKFFQFSKDCMATLDLRNRSEIYRYVISRVPDLNDYLGLGLEF